MSEIIIRPAAEKDIPEMLVLLVQVCNVHHRIRPDFFKKDATKYNADELKKILADCSRPIFAAVDRSDRMSVAIIFGSWGLTYFQNFFMTTLRPAQCIHSTPGAGSVRPHFGQTENSFSNASSSAPSFGSVSSFAIAAEMNAAARSTNVAAA